MNAPAVILDDIKSFLESYVIYPSEHAAVAHTLWIAHAHLMDRWDSTPRIAFISKEPGSGKSRALEVTAPLVPNPVHAVNATPAYLFRKISDDAGSPTILFDEIDTLFGPRAKDNEEVRGMLNAGHRRGATAGRAVVKGKEVVTEELPAYAAVALAGLNDLPDTIRARSIVVRMRRRAPNETVKAWRMRTGEAEAAPLAAELKRWVASFPKQVTWPTMPDGIEDRDADVWEALLAVADEAGGHWPQTARVAAVTLVADAKQRPQTLGVQLLSDLRSFFADNQHQDKFTTSEILDHLNSLDESPWGNIRGNPLDARSLSRRLSGYEVKPELIRDGTDVYRGYRVGAFTDPFTRYLPPLQADLPVTPVTDVTNEGEQGRNVTGVTDVTDESQNTRAPEGTCSGCGREVAPGVTTCGACNRKDFAR